jgi:hypothetical protein
MYGRHGSQRTAILARSALEGALAASAVPAASAAFCSSAFLSAAACKYDTHTTAKVRLRGGTGPRLGRAHTFSEAFLAVSVW